MEPGKRKPSGDTEYDQREPKRPKSELLHPLPPEVWEIIFQNLKVHWLRSARLTCSNWNQIIRSSSRLMDRFVLVLGSDYWTDHRQHVRSLLARGAGFTSANLSFCSVGNHKPKANWLKPIGTTLQSLTLETTGTLVLVSQILRELPYLKQLKVSIYCERTPEVNPDFRLDKLEELSIVSERCHNRTIRFFRQICSGLKVLKMNAQTGLECCDAEMIAFLFELRSSLEEFDGSLTYGFVKTLETMDGLRLKRARLKCFGVHSLLFVRLQPYLEELNIEIHWNFGLSPSEFNEMVSILPRLKSLRVTISAYQGQSPLSLQNLSRIEELSIEYGSDRPTPPEQVLDLIDCTLQNVRHLSLCRCNVSGSVLLMLQNTNISSLALSDCRIERLSDVLLLDSLNNLELIGSSRIEDIGEPAASSVRSLKVAQINREDLVRIVKLFPNLERFDAGEGVHVNRAILREIFQHSQQLKELQFGGCSFSKKCFGNALKQFTFLEILNVQCRASIRAKVSDALRGIRGDVATNLRVKD